MKKKPLDKIRITEICQAAEIERSTFYYHFEDKYELVAWIFFQSAEATVEMMFASMPDSLRRIYFGK